MSVNKSIIQRAKNKLIRLLGGYVHPFDTPVQYQVSEVKPLTCVAVAMGVVEPGMRANIVREHLEDQAIRKLFAELRRGGFVGIELYGDGRQRMSDEEFARYGGNCEIRASVCILPPNYQTPTSLYWFPTEEVR